MASPARLLSVVQHPSTTSSWARTILQTAPRKAKRDTAYAQWAKSHDRKGYREYIRFCDHQDQYAAQWQAPDDAEIADLTEMFDAMWDEYFPKPLQELSLLGLDADTPRDKRIVKNAYRRNARKLHPDTGGNAESFKALHTAYRKVLAITPA